MKPTFFKGIVLGSIIATVMSATAAYATVIVFDLGTTNTVDAASTVTAGTTGINAKVLTIDNKSTGSSASALNLTTASSRPPLTVSSGAKVVNLNSDKLDGIDSTGFVQGKGKAYTQAVSIGRNTDGTYSSLTLSPVVAPGFLNLALFCPPTSSAGGVFIEYFNLNSQDENVFLRNDYGSVTGNDLVIVGGNGQFATQNVDLTTLTVQSAVNGVQTVLTAQIATWVRTSDCHFQIQALTTHA